jgi:uncharacterized protein YoxC
MKLTIGPGSAVVLGLGLAVGTGNGDKIMPSLNSLAGSFINTNNLPDIQMPDIQTGTSNVVESITTTGADVFSVVNSKLDDALKEMRQLVRSEPPVPQMIQIQSNQSSGSWTLFAIKCLLVVGAATGICHVCGIDTWALLGYGKKTIETTVQGLQVTMTALQRGCEQGLETISELMAKYRGDMKDMNDKTKQKLEGVDGNVDEVREKVFGVADSVGRMSDLSHRTNMGVQLMCQVLSENLPKSSLQQKLQNFAATTPQLEDKPKGGYSWWPFQSQSQSQSLPGPKIIELPDDS